MFLGVTNTYKQNLFTLSSEALDAKMSYLNVLTAWLHYHTFNCSATSRYNCIITPLPSYIYP